MYEQLIQKQTKLAVIGLGYVGLPIALEFARKLNVIGFDINAKRVDQMRNNIDPSGELEAKDFEGCDIEFTDSLDVLREATFYIVAVPTPIDEHAQPDLKPLLGASSSVGKVLKKGDYVVFESTVYPGCTEEDCIPVMEKLSGLKFPEDFKVGYSPERINPGDKEHTLSSIVKVVAGCDAESLEELRWLIERHQELTGSPQAARLLDDWISTVAHSWLVAPVDHIRRMEAQQASTVAASA